MSNNVFKQATRYIPRSFKHQVKLAGNRITKKVENPKKQVQKLWKSFESTSRPHRRNLSWWYQLRIKRKTPILVYQMGKVGSRSIESSLKQLGYLVMHSHTLETTWIEPLLAPSIVTRFHNNHAPRGKWIRDNVIEPGMSAKVITLVRDPIALSLSSFFNQRKHHVTSPQIPGQPSIDELTNRYYEVQDRICEAILKWFDNEVKVHMGVDLLKEPFDSEKGFGRVHHGAYDILILKQELSNEERGEI